VHKHARLTPKGRETMLARLQAGQHQADVAQAMGVSLTTLKKWLRRFRQEGLAGLQDRSSRPRQSPRALCERVQRRIIALRQQRRTGRLIVRQLGVSAASVSRVLRRAELSRWRDLQPAAPVVRYQHEHPGELIHLDVKKLGRIKGLGHRITGDRRSGHRNRGIGARVGLRQRLPQLRAAFNGSAALDASLQLASTPLGSTIPTTHQRSAPSG
jgi:transposase